MLAWRGACSNRISLHEGNCPHVFLLFWKKPLMGLQYPHPLLGKMGVPGEGLAGASVPGDVA